jgi:hypothetical protein
MNEMQSNYVEYADTQHASKFYDAVSRLHKLADSNQGQAYQYLHLRMNAKEIGAIVAVLRFGHYIAGKMMFKAGINIRSAIRLVGVARLHGYTYRRPAGCPFRKSLDFTSK